MMTYQLTVLEGLRGINESLALLNGGSYLSTEGEQSLLLLNDARAKDLLARVVNEGLDEAASLCDRVDGLASSLENLFKSLGSAGLGEMEAEMSDLVREADQATTGLWANAREAAALSNRFPNLKKALRRRINVILEQSIRILRIVVVYYPAMLEFLTQEVRARVLTYRISWWAYLRSMGNLFWSAIRHPLSETTIDLSTGGVMYRI